MAVVEPVSADVLDDGDASEIIDSFLARVCDVTARVFHLDHGEAIDGSPLAFDEDTYEHEYFATEDCNEANVGYEQSPVSVAEDNAPLAPKIFNRVGAAVILDWPDVRDAPGDPVSVAGPGHVGEEGGPGPGTHLGPLRTAHGPVHPFDDPFEPPTVAEAPSYAHGVSECESDADSVEALHDSSLGHAAPATPKRAQRRAQQRQVMDFETPVKLPPPGAEHSPLRAAAPDVASCTRLVAPLEPDANAMMKEPYVHTPPSVRRAIHLLQVRRAPLLEAVFALFDVDGDGFITSADLFELFDGPNSEANQSYFARLGMNGEAICQAVHAFNGHVGKMDPSTFMQLMAVPTE